MKLYLYSGLTNGALAWAQNPKHFRELVGPSDAAIRVAHIGFDCPPNYHKPNGHLANDAIEPITPIDNELILSLGNEPFKVPGLSGVIYPSNSQKTR